MYRGQYTRDTTTKTIRYHFNIKKFDFRCKTFFSKKNPRFPICIRFVYNADWIKLVWRGFVFIFNLSPFEMAKNF